METKSQREPDEDPVEALRRDWDTYVAFGLANPAAFALMYARPQRSSKAAAAGLAVLRGRVRRVALTGRLKLTSNRPPTSSTPRAPGLSMLLEKPPTDRAGLSHTARDAVFAAV